MASIADNVAWRDLTPERQAWLVCRKDAERSSRRWYDQIARVLGGGGRWSGA